MIQCNCLKLSLMTTRLCLQTIQQTLEMVAGWIRHLTNQLYLNKSSVAKRYFFTVLYLSPACNHSSPEFQAFLFNFENLHSKIPAENPFAFFILVISMHILSYDGRKVTLLWKVWKLKLFLHQLFYLKF